MKGMNRKKLRQIAGMVRLGLRAKTPYGPSGMCFAWNGKLGAQLKREYRQSVRFVRGQFRTDKGDRGHYWLVVDGLIVDITGSQFNYLCKEPLNLVTIIAHPDGRFIEELDVTAQLDRICY